MLACSGDMLLQALAACAGVTLSAVATSLGIEVHGGRLQAEGDLDFRGTLGVAEDAPSRIPRDPLFIGLDSSASADERRKLLAGFLGLMERVSDAPLGHAPPRLFRSFDSGYGSSWEDKGYEWFAGV